MKKEFLEVGKISGTHGIRGMLRFQGWCDDIDFLKKVKKVYFDEKGNTSANLEKVAQSGNVFVFKLSGVDSIKSAENLRNRILYINRKDILLENGRYFIEDLIDCVVLDFDSGEKLGVITDVSKTGANDVWHITEGDKEYLVPKIPDVVKEVDIENDIVKIVPLKGIFDDED